MTDKIDGACCAHIHVEYHKRNNADGTCSDDWTCRDCGTHFFPSAARVPQVPEASDLVAMLTDAHEALRSCLYVAERRGQQTNWDALTARLQKLTRALHARLFPKTSIYAENGSVSDTKEHPERRCQRCGNPNPSWHAPNELWNKVTGHPAGLIICPMCFQGMAGSMGENVHFTVESFRASERLHTEGK